MSQLSAMDAIYFEMLLLSLADIERNYDGSALRCSVEAHGSAVLRC